MLLTSFLGTHVLVMKGDLVAGLIKPGSRAQLDFVLATFFGKLTRDWLTRDWLRRAWPGPGSAWPASPSESPRAAGTSA